MSETFNQKQYKQATPIPAKFLLPDGTVVDELPMAGGGGGSGGTSDYNDLMNKPKINGNTLRGNLTSNDLGLASKTEVENKVEKEDGKGLISNAEKEQITKNKTAIEVLNGDESVEGSVIKQIATALGKLNTLTKEIVNAVPSVSVAKDNVIYLLKAVSGNTYEMYSLVTLPDNSKAMASLGSTEIDLDGYLTEANAQRLYLALSTVKEEVLAKFNSVTEEGILYLTFNGSKVLTLSQLESLFYTKEEIDGMIGEAVVDDTKTSATTAYSSEKVQNFMDETNEEIGKLNDSLVDKVDKNSPTFEHDVTIDGTLRVETAGYIADSKIATMDDLVDIESDLGELANVNRRQRRDITTNLSNLSTAIAEQNLEKYGYTIGDYFVGASGYKYHLADLDTYYGGYNSYGVVGTHHIGIVVDTGANTAWLSSGTVTSYNKSTLHALLTSTVLDKVKSDITALFGSWNNHLLAHQMLDNAVGGWGDTWVADTYIKAMSEVEIYGSTVFSADGFQTGIANKKLSIFNKYKYNEIFGNKNIWLKSLSSASAACAAAHAGNAYDSGVSDSNGAVGLILFY